MSSPQAAAHPQVPGLESDETGARVVGDELRLLAVVQAALAAAEDRGASAQKTREEDDARLLELRDDVATAKPEDLPSLFEQMHHVGALRAQRGKGAAGSIDRGSPYFGHLRLDEGGRRRDVLVGGKSYLDTAAGIRIVDWRQAPVSRIYYRYLQGDEYEEQLGGRSVEGVVTARRSVSIVKGELVRVAAPEGTFVRSVDGTWKRIEVTAARLQTSRRGGDRAQARLGMGANGRSREDKHLPAIASMLDKEQFDLITRPGMGLIAVQGSAGSGKTTVGLHRVAYLAFADAQRFRPDRLLVVVPNEALRHYVERVLPSLGVEGVQITTFARLSTKTLAALLPKLTTRIADDTPPVVSRLKSHPKVLRAIDAAARRLHAELDGRAARALERWPDGGVAAAAWRETASPAATCDARVTAFAAWVAGKREVQGVAPASSLPDVTRGAVERLGHELRNAARSVLATWDEILTSRERLAADFGEDFGPGQLDVVHEWCVRQARLRNEGERDGEHAQIDAEDVALLLRLWQSIRGPLTASDGSPLRYAHVFVDEVQDASPVELRVLLDLTTKERSVTLAGDVAQRMLEEGDDRGELDWKKLLEELGLPATTMEPLKVSYRSTAEITAFARGVLGPYAHDTAPIPTRHGPPVDLFTFASPGEAVAFLADALKQLGRDEPYANVALAARFPQQADVYFEGLARAEVPRLRRIREQDFTWDAGFDVTDVRQTKGLEFDEVILLETGAASYPDTAPARHALYVGATRAAHQLWCATSEKPSPIVFEALAVPAAEPTDEDEGPQT